MSGSIEFTTWAALASAAAGVGVVWLFSSSPYVLAAVAVAGAYLGYLGERAGRRYLERRLSGGG